MPLPFIKKERKQRQQQKTRLCLLKLKFIDQINVIKIQTCDQNKLIKLQNLSCD